MWHTPKSVVLITCERTGDVVPTGLHARSLYEVPVLNDLLAAGVVLLLLALAAAVREIRSG